MPEFVLPDVGEGLTEAEIITWRVRPGQTVAVNDVLVDIETAKSIVELPSPFAGEVAELLVPEGTTVTVGTPIIRIGADAPESSEPEPERQAMLVGYGPRTGPPTRRRRVASVDTEKVPLARPPVRKLAKDLGIDLAAVPCDGEFVTRADVEAFARSGPVTPPDGDVRVPIKGVRKMTAQAMVESAFTAPHVTEWVTVDVSRTMELTERLSVSPTVVVAKAVCLAIRRSPELNSSWDEQAQEIVLKGSVTLGIAVATERGLVVPNIPRADQMSLADLAAAITELTATARAGRTQPAQMTGGSFTITNVGVFGVDAGTPILNPGEAGILAVGQIARRPWVLDEDTIAPRWVTTLALSFDHRLVDGQQGSRFLADVAAILHDPAEALTY